MKVFDLVCCDGHRCEGWFGSSEQFASQSESGAVRCPLCDSAEIHREPSAPRLNLGSEITLGPAPVPPNERAVAAAVVAKLRQMVAETENVGARFAEEARRIHYAEVPARAIRGTATDRERQSLVDEGIETLTIALPAVVTETLQ